VPGQVNFEVKPGPGTLPGPDQGNIKTSLDRAMAKPGLALGNKLVSPGTYAKVAVASDAGCSEALPFKCQDGSCKITSAQCVETNGEQRAFPHCLRPF
jgi:hypothetical protein